MSADATPAAPDILRPHAEVQYAHELAALARGQVPGTFRERR